MTRGKSGEGLRGGHRKGIRPTTVIQGGLNSPRVSSDRGANLEDLRHPIRDSIGSSLPMRRAKAAGEATVAIRKETGTKGSAADLVVVAASPSPTARCDDEEIAATKKLLALPLKKPT
jgi:hypothetical protein